MQKLNELRQQIDKVDQQILKALKQRAQLAIKVGQIKRDAQQPVYAPEREQRLLDDLATKNQEKGPVLEPSALLAIYREILSACRALQEPLRVAYLGPAGTYSQTAAWKQFGHAVELQPQENIGDVFHAVENGSAPYGVVPIENSTEGVVTTTMDRLMESPLQICGEIMLQIEHCLLGSVAGGIKKIYSHPQALAQCRHWLERHHPQVEVIPTTSTAQAARLAAAEPSACAIASAIAAEVHGLAILEKGIQDNPHNMTRFLVLSAQSPAASGNDKTSLVFAVKDDVGVLFKLLQPFAKAGINLSKIESRPMLRLNANQVKSRGSKQAWEYAFFIDLAGHRETPKVKTAIQALEKQCVYLKVLGSYPRAQ